MPARTSYDLVIVGLGSAGLVAAELAHGLGIEVAAVERDRVGGDCLWTGCVPSKALLAAGRAAQAMRGAGLYGIEPVEPAIDTAKVLARVRSVQARIEAEDDNPERLRELGIDVHLGAARLTGPNTLHVEGSGELSARFVLLCTGSRPALPAIEGLAEAGYLTSESFWEVERLPESLVVIGGGPIAVELAQACNRLGSTVTVLQRDERILPRDEPELADTLAEVLRSEGVELVLGAEPLSAGADGAQKVVRGRVGGSEREWRAAEILVGAGRAPNVEGLGLEAAGVATGPRGVIVDERMRTAVGSIYAVGDLAGRHLFTHSAGYEAAGAVRSMFFPGSQKGPALVPWCTFTDPELAHAGLTEAGARAEHGDAAVEVWIRRLERSDRARADGHDEGQIRIVTATGKVVGAHALAPAAGELIGELALAIHKGLKLTDLASVVHVYPTYSLSVGQAAGDAAVRGAERFKFLVRSRV